jgi:gliding motility-associated-like protein
MLPLERHLRLGLLLSFVLIAAMMRGQTTTTFSYSGGVQSWTVPAGIYQISISGAGAQGGNSGGLGALIQGDFAVTPGQVLNILVGGVGVTQSNNSGGGGGGTFVWNVTTGNTLYLAAGGGGGRAGNSNSSQGGAGSATTSSTNSINGSGNGSGGSIGNGGTGGNPISTGITYPGAGGAGAGWSSNGGNAAAATYSGSGGIQPLSGGNGGNAVNSTCGSIPYGGFGGGGGGGGCSGAGGGGGGYTGGGGGNGWNGSTWGSGGGGGSYNGGTSQSNTSGSNSGNGSVSIAYTICSLPTIPTTFTSNPMSRLHTITSVNIAGTGNNTAYVSPGQTVSLSFNYSIATGGTSCPGCITQTYVGIAGEWGTCVQSYGGYCNCSSSFSTSFTAPSTPGLYFFTLGTSWLFSCGTPLNYIPGGTNGFGAIIVRESFSSAIDNESCAGSLDGSIAVTPDNATSGNTFLWSTGATTSTISSLSPGTYSVTSTDTFGCAQIDTFSIYSDTIKPSIVVSPLTIVLDSASGASTISNDSADAGSTDACGIASIALDNTTFDCGDIGTFFLVQTVTDSSGNFDTAHVWTTVVDATAPHIATLDSLTVYLDAITGTYTLDTSDVLVSTFDACGWSVTLDTAAFDCSGHGTSFFVYATATDPSGNSTTDSTYVTVLDTALPAVVTQNINVWLDAFGNGAIVANDIDNGTSDACGLQPLVIDISTFDCSDVGTPVTVTLTATDLNGNSDSATAIVTVLDTVLPDVVTKNIVIQLDTFGNATIANDSVEDGSSDACGILSITLNDTAFDCFDVGAPVQIIQTVTDVNLNADTAHAYVTVQDLIAPEMHTYDSVTVYLDVNGQYTLTAVEVDSASYDACGITYVLDTFNFDCANHAAPLSVVVTGFDPSGNSSSDTTVVTVLDTLAPNVITQNITVFLDNTGSASITANDIDNGTTDGCGVNTLSIDTSTFSCASWNTPITVTLTATDNFGNSGSNTAIVTVLDTISPIATAITSHILYLDTFGNASLTGLDVNNGSSDNCAIETWVLNDSLYDCSDVGAPFQIVLTVTDSSGNSDTAHAYVQVFDTLAPLIAIQNSFVYLDSSGTLTIPANHVNQATFDACGIAVMTLDTSYFDCSGHGDTITALFYVEDVNGNADSQLVDLYVLDTLGPAVFTQGLTVYLDSSGGDTIAALMIDNGSWDSCGIASYALDDSIFNCVDVGPVTVTLTVTDVHGNAFSQTAVVNVLDTIAPDIRGRDTTLTLANTGQLTLIPSMVDTGTFEACGIDTSYVFPNQFNCGDVGSVIGVQLTVIDIHGNTSIDSFNVTIIDSVAPTLLTQPITVQLDSNGAVAINYGMIDLGTWDSCGLDSIWLEQTAFDCSELGANSINFYASDIHGNVDSTAVIVTVEDLQLPVVLTNNLTLYLDGTGQATIAADSVDNNSFDNCTIDTIWLDQYTFTCPDTASAQIITLFVRDQSANVDSATATITVLDTLAPFMFANNLMLALDSFGFASIIEDDIDSASYDNCDIALRWLSRYTFSCADVGAPQVVTFYAQDVSGNLDSVSVVVTVIDTIAPKPIVQNIVLALDSFGQAIIDSNDVDAGSWDSCGIQLMWLEQDLYSCLDIGLNTRWFYAEDIHGNVDSASFTVEVIDTIAPQIEVFDTFYVFLDSFGLASVTADSIDLGTWDSCGLSTISIDTSSFTCANHGDTLSVAFTAEDIHGNVSVDISTFIILDTIAPLIFAHSDTFYLDSAGQFVLAASILNDSTQDACGVDSLYLSDTLFTCSTVDSTIDITFFAVDVFGNTNSQVLQITALDTIHPIIYCLSNIVVSNDTGQCGAIVDFTWPTAWDNCSVDSIVQIDTTLLDSGSFFPVGLTELTYVAYDQSGNTDTCSFTIEVQDVEAPELFCQGDTLICDTTYIFTYPSYADNCTGFDVVQVGGIESGGFYPVGSTINRFAVTDSYGNTDTCEYEVFRYDFPSIANAGPDQEKCEEYSATLDGNVPVVGFGTWSLISGTGTLTDSLDEQAIIDGISVGYTYLEWRIENGVCPIERDTMFIREYINPTAANAGLDQIVCDTTEAMLGAIMDTIGIGTWLPTSNGTSVLDTTASNALVNGLSLGTYSYIWRVVNGVCPITFDTVDIEVVPYTEVDAGPDRYVFFPSNIQIGAISTLPATFTWSPVSALAETSGDSVIATPSETTSYVVLAETEFGCRTRDTIVVGVNKGPVLPTAFTPDGDNYNDLWNLKELESYPDCVVKIYNRWGHLMFESKGYTESWDGTFNGEPLPSGSYFYVIELNVDEVPPQTGSVTIIK